MAATLMDVFQSFQAAASPFLQEGTEQLKQRNDLQFQVQTAQIQANVQNFLQQHQNQNPAEYADDLKKMVGGSVDFAKAQNGSAYYQQRMKAYQTQAEPAIQNALAQQQITYNRNKAITDFQTADAQFRDTAGADPAWILKNRWLNLQNLHEQAGTWLPYAKEQEYQEQIKATTYQDLLTRNLQQAQSIGKGEVDIDAVRRQTAEQFRAAMEGAGIPFTPDRGAIEALRPDEDALNKARYDLAMNQTLLDWSRQGAQRDAEEVAAGIQQRDVADYKQELEGRLIAAQARAKELESQSSDTDADRWAGQRDLDDLRAARAEVATLQGQLAGLRKAAAPQPKQPEQPKPAAPSAPPDKGQQEFDQVSQQLAGPDGITDPAAAAAIAAQEEVVRKIKDRFKIHSQAGKEANIKEVTRQRDEASDKADSTYWQIQALQGATPAELLKSDPDDVGSAGKLRVAIEKLTKEGILDPAAGQLQDQIDEKEREQRQAQGLKKAAQGGRPDQRWIIEFGEPPAFGKLKKPAEYESQAEKLAGEIAQLKQSRTTALRSASKDRIAQLKAQYNSQLRVVDDFEKQLKGANSRTVVTQADVDKETAKLERLKTEAAERAAKQKAAEAKSAEAQPEAADAAAETPADADPREAEAAKIEARIQQLTDQIGSLESGAASDSELTGLRSRLDDLRAGNIPAELRATPSPVDTPEMRALSDQVTQGSAALDQMQSDYAAKRKAAEQGSFYVGQRSDERAALDAAKKRIYQQNDNTVKGWQAEFRQMVINDADPELIVEFARQHRAAVTEMERNDNITGNQSYEYRDYFNTDFLIKDKGKKKKGAGGGSARDDTVLHNVFVTAVETLIPRILNGEISGAAALQSFKRVIDTMDYPRYLKDSGRPDNEATLLRYTAWARTNNRAFADAIISALQTDPRYKNQMKDASIDNWVRQAEPEDLSLLGLNPDNPKDKDKIQRYEMQAGDYLRGALGNLVLTMATNVSPQELDRQAQNIAAGYMMNIGKLQHLLTSGEPGSYTEEDLAGSLQEYEGQVWGYANAVAGGDSQTLEYTGNREATAYNTAYLARVAAATFGVPEARLALSTRDMPTNARGQIQGIPRLEYDGTASGGINGFSFEREDNKVFVIAHYKDGSITRRRMKAPPTDSETARAMMEAAQKDLDKVNKEDEAERLRKAQEMFDRRSGWSPING
jgi:hypothetical protein